LTPELQPAVLVGTQAPTLSAANALQGGALTLNGRSIGSTGTSFTSLSAVATAINTAAAANPALGLTATVTNGKLTISAASGDTTQDIRLGLNLGAGASPDDLRKLGFNTTLHVSGPAKDDLLLFVTDSQASVPGQTSTKAQLYSQFDGVQGDMKQVLRAGKLLVNFDRAIQPNPPDPTKLHYTITDSLTGTVVAQRHIDAAISNPSIDYRGLHLEFSTTPKAGDVFTVDGNRDGIGNNEAMLQLVNLEDKEVMPGGLTLTEAYIERVNLVGNTARQANIAQQALQVVYKQAKETRDGVSGVSLDEEATNLVRYQQAYQANAKVMQIGSQLFDAILQVSS
jgi:flagellar hook-associated protein FlgK